MTGSESGTVPISLVSLVVIGLAGSLLLICCACLLIRMRLGRIGLKKRTRRVASKSRATKALPPLVEQQSTESGYSRDDEEEEERLAVEVADELQRMREERWERRSTSGERSLPATPTVVGATISELVLRESACSHEATAEGRQGAEIAHEVERQRLRRERLSRAQAHSTSPQQAQFDARLQLYVGARSRPAAEVVNATTAPLGGAETLVEGEEHLEI